MPEPEPLSALKSRLDAESVRFRSPNILIEERPFVRKLAIRGRVHDASFMQRFTKVIGTAPPAPGRSTDSAEGAIISVGPTEWLAVSIHIGSAGPRPIPNDLMDRFAAAGIAVVDVSSATTILRISGPLCLSTLRRLCALPLDRLASGSAARTRMGRLAILVLVLEATRFDLFVPRSFARSFFEQLRDAAESQR